MASSCLGRDSCTREFTVLLVHVLYVSHRLALEGSTTYARELVDRCFKKYTHIDVSQIEPHARKFRNLIFSFQLEIVFEGHPKGYRLPIIKCVSTSIHRG
jgi:hypothetical protein